MPLVQLVYTSRPSRPLSSNDLMQILATARSVNSNNGVTGLLFYTGSLFIQMLEGDRQAVSDTYHAIVRDARHNQVALQHFGYVDSRLFSDWSMGYAGVGDIRSDLIRKHAPDGDVEALAFDHVRLMALIDDISADLELASAA